MIDICPICGSQLSKEIWLMNPPTRGLKCTKCGRVEETFGDAHLSHPRNCCKGRTYPFGREFEV